MDFIQYYTVATLAERWAVSKDKVTRVLEKWRGKPGFLDLGSPRCSVSMTSIFHIACSRSSKDGPVNRSATLRKISNGSAAFGKASLPVKRVIASGDLPLLACNAARRHLLGHQSPCFRSSALHLVISCHDFANSLSLSTLNVTGLSRSSCEQELPLFPAANTVFTCHKLRRADPPSAPFPYWRGTIT
jgi:hypothetical protein